MVFLNCTATRHQTQTCRPHSFHLNGTKHLPDLRWDPISSSLQTPKHCLVWSCPVFLDSTCLTCSLLCTCSTQVLPELSSVSLEHAPPVPCTGVSVNRLSHSPDWLEFFRGRKVHSVLSFWELAEHLLLQVHRRGLYCEYIPYLWDLISEEKHGKILPVNTWDWKHD